MPPDLFGLWSGLPAGTKIHPEDQTVFDRIQQEHAPGHEFQLKCLPSPYAGPLRTAPIVFLYLSAGWTEQDSAEADTDAAKSRQWAQWQGDALLPGQAEHPSGWKWWASRSRPFLDLAAYRDKIAFLNIGAYHSKDFTAYPLLSALPSCRMAVSWAQFVLFPQAEAGERVVVCLRSAAYWGLPKGRVFGRSLFVPNVTRGGHPLNQDPMISEAKTRIVELLTR